MLRVTHFPFSCGSSVAADRKQCCLKEKRLVIRDWIVNWLKPNRTHSHGHLNSVVFCNRKGNLT